MNTDTETQQFGDLAHTAVQSAACSYHIIVQCILTTVRH